MILIGFTGKMGSGKSTAIECLRYLQPEMVHNVKFAQPLYDMQEFIYRRISRAFPTPDPLKDRKLLQWLGTEWGRGTINESIWTKLWEEEVKYLSENYPNSLVVCDDVRFDNEADVLHARGGVVVSIVSSKTENREVARGGLTNHASEAGIDANKVDFIVRNDDTVKDLGNQLKDILKTLNKGANNGI